MMTDPRHDPTFSLQNRISRVAWMLVYWLLFRPSPRPLHEFRAILLRLFGARIGADCHVYPGAKIWAPWNLRMEDEAGIADGVNLYSVETISFGRRALAS